MQYEKSETWNECNMNRMLPEKSATWKKCNIKMVQPEKSAIWYECSSYKKLQHEMMALWKVCRKCAWKNFNMGNIRHEKRTTWRNTAWNNWHIKECKWKIIPNERVQHARAKGVFRTQLRQEFLMKRFYQESNT